MRTLEECTAEVFRRSEIKIKKRKDRKRVLLCCIPLLLCICTLLLWPEFPERSADGGIWEFGGVPERGSSGSTALHCFVVKTADMQYMITDANTVDLILGILDAPNATENQTEQNFNTPTEEISPPAGPTLYAGGPKGNGSAQYDLTYRSTDGQTRSYTLTDDTLICSWDGSSKQLTGDALLALLQALESSQQQEDQP